MSSQDEERILRGKKFLLSVETSDRKDDYQKYEDLREEIWKDPSDRMAGNRNMLCENYFDRGSCLFTAAYAEDDRGILAKDTAHFVGFSYGFVGVKDKGIGFRSPDNLVFYSQYLGVKGGYRDFGLGVALKEHQGRAVKDVLGISTMTCTYDPLVGVNAYRNIHRFRMEVLEYRVACYEDLGGALNRLDVPSDRLIASWHLAGGMDRPKVDLDFLLEEGAVALSAGLKEVKTAEGSVLLEVVEDVRLDREGDFLLLEIPFDFYRMLRLTDVHDEYVRRIPFTWRMITREVFQALLSRGYKVVDFLIQEGKDRKRDFYVLSKA